MKSLVATGGQPADARRALGFVLALAGAILFSAKAVVAKLTYEYGIDAVTLIAFRMLFALPFFAVIAWVQSRRAARRESAVLSWRERLQVVALGLTGYYLSSFLDFLGLQTISAGLERLILFLSPSMVLLISAFWLRRPIVARQWVALVLSYLGVVLVFAHDVSFGGSSVILGSAYVLGSALTYALYLIFSGELLKRIGATRLVAYAMTVSCVACLLQFFLIHPPSMLLQPAGVYGLSVFHAVFNTVLPVFMVMWAVDRVGAPLAAQLGMIGPVSVLFLAYVFLGEPITAWQLAGTALVLAGVFILSGVRKG